MFELTRNIFVVASKIIEFEASSIGASRTARAEKTLCLAGNIIRNVLRALSVCMHGWRMDLGDHKS